MTEDARFDRSISWAPQLSSAFYFGEGPHNYLTETVKTYKSELGPVWGSVEEQRSRATMLDQALRFCNELPKLTDRIVLGNRVSRAEIATHVPSLQQFKQGAF